MISKSSASKDTIPFHYSSIQTHGNITADGKRIKITRVDIRNGEGVKTVTVKDNKGVHTNSIPLNNEEIKNVKNHTFMPSLFETPMTNVKNMKSAVQTKTTHRKSKKNTRKIKK